MVSRERLAALLKSGIEDGDSDVLWYVVGELENGDSDKGDNGKGDSVRFTLADIAESMSELDEEEMEGR